MWIRVQKKFPITSQRRGIDILFINFQISAHLRMLMNITSLIPHGIFIGRLVFLQTLKDNV